MSGSKLTTLLAVRNFRFFFLARTVSLYGDMMLPIAITAAVLAAGYGASGVGFVLAAHLGPMVAFMLVGGALADHFRPKPLMLIADLVRFGAQGVLAVLLVSGHPELWQIVVLEAICGLATAMFQPGKASVIAEVAPGHLQQANALLRITESVMTFAGPALAGVLLAFASPAAVIAVDAGTFLLSAVFLALLRVNPRSGAGRPSVLRDIRVGWQEFCSRTWLWMVIVVFAVLGLTVFGPYNVLSATVLTLDHGVSTYGFLAALFGVGAVLGGGLALRFSPERPLYAGALALLVYAPQFVFIAVGAPLPIIAVSMFVAGVGRSYWAVMWSTAVQSNVPLSVMSRVSAYEITGSMVLIPVGRAIAGPMADSVGAQLVLLVSGVFAAAGCAVMIVSSAIRTLPATKPEPVIRRSR